MSLETVLAASSTMAAVPKVSRLPWITTACIVLTDFLALSFVFSATILGRHFLWPGYHLTAYVQLLPCLVMVFAAFGIQGLYPGVLLHPAEEMRRVFLSITTVFLIIASTTFLWRNGEVYSRAVLLIACAAGPPFILLFRGAARRILGPTTWWGVSAVILGSGASAQRVVNNLRDGKLGIRVDGVLSEDQVLSLAQDMPPFLGNLASAAQIGRSRSAQYAIVAMHNKSSAELRDAVQDYCRGFSHVLLIPDLQGVCSLRVTAREVAGQVALELPQRLFHRSSAAIKRTLDIFASAALLVILSPLFGIMACAVKLTSQGPVLYRHMRYGRDGTVFKALKFRTMLQNGDQLLRDYFVRNPQAKMEWQLNHKIKEDPRVTPIGKWLRRFSLDELPQLFNVVAGHMSLVGPRPIVELEIAKYGRGYDLYTRVLPGVTGLWQVSGRNNTTYEERVSLDEYYVRNWSVWLDIYILIRTIKVVVTSEGAY
jgi:Undecaprenyl-phosphate galactose phosphotransferase WbaP